MPETVIDPKIFGELKESMGADFIGELIDTYVQETPPLILQLRQALTAMDSETFGRVAHSIKSSSAAFGALDLAAKARELEMMGKSGSLDGASSKLEQLASEYERAEQALMELKNGG